MTKKIVLRSLIFLAIILIVILVLYFNTNYVIINTKYGTKLVSTDVTRILFHNVVDEEVNCFSGLKKLTKLEKLCLSMDEKSNLEYLSEMSNLQYLILSYNEGYCGRLETLPDLPNLKDLHLTGDFLKRRESNFVLLNDKEYNFSSINTLSFAAFDSVDLNSLYRFENLEKIIISERCLSEEQIEELQNKGVTVEFN